MKVFYVVFLTEGNYSGVNKKISQQSNALTQLGVDCFLIIISTKALINSNIFRENKNVIILDNWRCSLPLVRRMNKIQKIKQIIDNISQKEPFMIYMRYTPPDFFLISLAKKYTNRIITEHQTFELQEWFSNYYWVPILLETLFGKSFRRYMGGITGVTSEICRYERARSGRDVPCFVASNGIDVSAVPTRKNLTRTNGEALHLLCVAQVAKWHGLDRLIGGLADSGKSTVYIHIVGDGPAIQQLKELVSQKHLEDQVIFHGFKTGEELDEMFNYCHIAVGSLGIHRLGLQEGSVLKVREYCARGIPFIYSPVDQDFPESFPFRLKVPSDDSPINIKEVMCFAKKVLADREHPQIMREYALSNLDWKIKMRKLKSFFEEVLKKQVGK